LREVRLMSAYAIFDIDIDIHDMARLVAVEGLA
jgi:hypothetical protein